MELTIKRITGRYRWIVPMGLVLAILVFFVYYYFSAIDFNVKKEEPEIREITGGWAKMANGRKGKVIFAQPPVIIILDLNSGAQKKIPSVVVDGAKGRFKRGASPRPSWSPDGKKFIYRYDGGIYACDEHGSKKEIKNEHMNCSDETRWTWHVSNGQDWAVGPSKDGNVIMVKMSDPEIFKTIYGGGDVIKHCEMTGTGKYIVYARTRDIYIARVGCMSAKNSLKISQGQSCRPCAAPDNRVAWLPVPHIKYNIHETGSGKHIGMLNAPPGEEIYRLNWSNDPDFAVHMYGSQGNERIHVRRIGSGEYVFIGNGWDPDLWLGEAAVVADR